MDRTMPQWAFKAMLLSNKRLNVGSSESRWHSMRAIAQAASEVMTVSATNSSLSVSRDAPRMRRTLVPRTRIGLMARVKMSRLMVAARMTSMTISSRIDSMSRLPLSLALDWEK